MTALESAVPVSRPRLVRAAFFAAAITVIGAAFPATSTAEPVWDIEEYDYCMRQAGSQPPGQDPIAKEEENDRYCCYRSGGQWNGLTCAAPPAKDQAVEVPPGGVREGLPTVRVQPSDVLPVHPPLGDLSPMPMPSAG
jgi:hypothetical protein